MLRQDGSEVYGASVIDAAQQLRAPVCSAEVVPCRHCGREFRRTPSDVRQRKRKCRECRVGLVRSYRQKMRLASALERRKLTSRLDKMREEMVRLQSILARAPLQTRAAYALSRDPAGALARAIAERDELQERVRQLEGLIRGDEWVPEGWGLSGYESMFLSVLTYRSPVSREYVYTVIYGSQAGDGPDPKVLDVMLAKMRPKLSSHGIIIETIHGVGYRLSPDSLAKCRTLKAEWGQ